MNLPILNFTGTLAQIFIPTLNSLSAPTGFKILALAHAKAEGYKPGTLAFNRNNPGNLMNTKFQFIVFPNIGAGTSALIDYMSRVASGKHPAYSPKGDTTLAQYIHKYAPQGHGGNDEATYVKTIIDVFATYGINISANTTLAAIGKVSPDEKKKSSDNSSSYSFFDSIRFMLLGHH